MMRAISKLLLASLMLGAVALSIASPAPAAQLAPSAQPEHAAQLAPSAQPEHAAQQALLQYAAADFTQHGPSVHQVRHVHLRYNLLALGERSYLLCGEFRSSGDPAQWTSFATIKTDPYEQWVGAMAKSQCEQATAVSAAPTDLSAELEASIRAAK